MFDPMPSDWRAVLAETLRDPRMAALEERVSIERKTQVVYPAGQNVFAAFRLTPYASVRAVIIGQDPYLERDKLKVWRFPSRRVSHTGVVAKHPCGARCRHRTSCSCDGSLVPWAQHGVLLLNTYLTVRAGEPASHRRYGWQLLTGAVIQAVNAKPGPVAFLLWGAAAQAQGRSIDRARHVVMKSAHPSPLSAYRGFIGNAPFRRANEELVARGASPIDWRLP